MTESAKRLLHERAGARFTQLGDSKIVSSYGDVAAEYQALRHSAGVLDLSFRGRLCLTGKDRVRFLHGQVTNDVQKLKQGQGCYAGLVNAKGKIESDLNIYALNDELLLDFEPGLTPKLTERFDKFIIADDVHVVDVSPHYGLVSVQGPQGEVVLRKADLGMEVPAEPFRFSSRNQENIGEIYCMKISRGPAIGFDLFFPIEACNAMTEKLVIAAKTIGGRLCGWDALEIGRIEAGLPRFGQDMDESNLAPETGIEQRAISYTKGCYIGQEVISRIRAYGQVAKALRGLRLEGEPLPKRGDKIFHEAKEAGYITSAIHSPMLNMNIALGYVRREHNAMGTQLVVSGYYATYPARAANAALAIMPSCGKSSAFLAEHKFSS